MSIPQAEASIGSSGFHPPPTGGKKEEYNPVAAFGQFGGMMVRVVNALQAAGSGDQYRPVSLLSPGAQYAIEARRPDQFGTRPDQVITVLKPAPGCHMLWAYKKDVCSNPSGEPCCRFTYTKKITSWHVLEEKIAESYHRKHSLFSKSPLTSGHLGVNGYLLHQPSEWIIKEAGKYPEILCHINFDRMHYGYLLDFTREFSFRRLEEVMGNILTLEQNKGNASGDEFREPVKLCLYNSYQGVLSPPVEISRTQALMLRRNIRAFSQYVNFTGQELRLYQLLSQSGGERFLQLLKNIPEQVSTVSASVKALGTDIKAILTAIENCDSATFLSELPARVDGVNSKVGLPNLLLEALLEQTPFHKHFPWLYYAFEIHDKQSSWDYIFEQVKPTFAAQAVICRELLNNKLFVPYLLGYKESTPVHCNPLVCCLLIAYGARIYLNYQTSTQPADHLEILTSANHFLRANLLTDDEANTIRNEVLWELLCNDGDGPVTKHYMIANRVSILRTALHEHLNHRQLDSSELRQKAVGLLGEEFYDRFFTNEPVYGHAVKEFLENRFSTRRYSDEQLREHLKSTATLNRTIDQRLSIFLGEYYTCKPAVVVRRKEQGECQPDWLVNFLASPPTFEGMEILPDGRYKSITLKVGQYYYQSPHPNRAQTILAKGIKPYYRKWHGLDHALRAQLATEFLIDSKVLPDFHKPFRELLLKHPELQELLPIAELYHDAVAEDEHKNVEELRAAELFQRDMTRLQQYPGQLVTLVASALRNKNCKMMDAENPSFTPDHQCTEEELLLRQVLRFGDTVDILRVKPPREDFPTIRLTPDSAEIDTSEMIHDGYFQPEKIELLSVVNNPDFTLLIQSVMLSFRDLASITGGWHHQVPNPFTSRYHLPVDNHKRRLLIEQAPDPYQCLRECLNDLVRFAIAEKAGISPCFTKHHRRSTDHQPPGCWDPDTGSGGAYRRLHNEGELRQVRLPEAMTLAEKMIVVANQPGLEKLMSADIRDALETETIRLQQKAILPSVGTLEQSELEQMLRQPDSPGARLLSERGYSVKSSVHDGKIFYQMMPNSTLARNFLLLPPEYDDEADPVTLPENNQGRY
ncbi:hypothetical protein [Endozoicomonas sp. ALB115]|uniref:hypothetical protein n=1 Tax=Endozoicomonas sp. ALB115 TaxID=3403074 RepID=UPI003BB70BA3